jgi:hypothetical protein
LGLRGLSFKSTGSGTLGFTFSGTGTLTVGRGGITNYDTSRQTISSTIALGASQYWDVGPGGVTAAAINTGTAGYLLEIDGSGTARLNGAISGSGDGMRQNGRLNNAVCGDYLRWIRDFENVTKTKHSSSWICLRKMLIISHLR